MVAGQNSVVLLKIQLTEFEIINDMTTNSKNAYEYFHVSVF